MKQNVEVNMSQHFNYNYYIENSLEDCYVIWMAQCTKMELLTWIIQSAHHWKDSSTIRIDWK